MPTPDRDRATDGLSNPDSCSAERSGCPAPALIAMSARASVASVADKTPGGAADERGGRSHSDLASGSGPRSASSNTARLLSAVPTLTALRALDRFGGHGQSVTFTATVSDLSPGGATPNGGNGHLQRPGRSDRQRDAGRRRGGVHDLEPGGGHGHRHGLLRRHRQLRPEHHGHDRDRRRQRHRRLRGQQRARDRRRAELPVWPRLRLRGRPVHRRLSTTTWSARWSRRPATSSPSPATAPPVTAATTGPRPPPN